MRIYACMHKDIAVNEIEWNISRFRRDGEKKEGQDRENDTHLESYYHRIGYSATASAIRRQPSIFLML